MALTLLAVGGCRPTDDGVGLAAGPRRGGRLLIIAGGLPAVPDPHVATVPHPAHSLLFETLLVRGPLGWDGGPTAPAVALYPQLAAAWSVSEDGREITLVLRRGVSFHDGRPLDAAAVKANLDRILALPAGNAARDLLVDLRQVEVIDEARVRLRLRRANPAIWQALASPLLSMVSPGSWEGAGWAGTGPYRLEAWGPDEVRVVRNEAYSWAPAFYRNTGPAFPEEVRLVTAADPVDGPYLRLTAGEGTVPHVRSPGEGLLYLCCNLGEEVLADAAVRRAVACAIDRDALVAAAQAAEGWWVATSSPVAPGLWGYDPATAGFFPPGGGALASQLLASSGWTRTSPDGRLTRQGVPLRLELLVQDRPATVAVASELARQLGELGMVLEVKVVSAGDALARAARGQFQLLLAGYQWGPDADVLHYFFHSSRRGATNRGGYASADVDPLLEAARLEMDPRLRWSMYGRAQRFLLSDLPWVPLLAPALPVDFDPEAVPGLLVGPAGSLWLHDVWLPGGVGR